jgi:WD40 repeat protein
MGLSRKLVACATLLFALAWELAPTQAMAQTQPRKDALGDPLPAGARLRLGTVRWHHAGGVNALAFSGDGKTLASGSRNRTIRLWDTATGQQRSLFVTDKTEAEQLALAPDGKTLAFRGYDRHVHLVDVASGKIVHSLPCNNLNGAGPEFAFAPDGQILATWGNDGMIRLWEVATGKERSSFAAEARAVMELTFTPDGKTLIGASDGKVYLWDPAAGKLLRVLAGSKGLPKPLAVSPDSKILATGGSDEVCLWDIAKGGGPKRLTGYKAPVTALGFSRDGRSLAAMSHDGDCRLWELATAKVRLQSTMPLHGRDVANPVLTAKFSPDADTLAWVEWKSSAHVRLMQVSTGKELFAETPQPSGGQVFFSAGAKEILTTGRDQGLTFWDAASGKPLRTFAAPEKTGRCLGWVLDGKSVLFLGKQAHVLDAATGKPLRQFAVAGSVDAYAISADGQTLVLGDSSMDRHIGPPCFVHFYDLTTGQAGNTLKCHAGTVVFVKLAPDGKNMLTAGGYFDNTVGVWETATGKQVARTFEDFRKSGNYVVGLAWRADSKIALKANFFFTDQGKDAIEVTLWNAVANKPIGSWKAPADSLRYSCVFSPTGKYAAFASYAGTLYVLDAATGKEHCRFETGRDGLSKIMFSPDEKSVAASMGNATVLVWDLP